MRIGSPRWIRTPNLRLNRGADIQTAALFEPRQILHQPPVFQPVLLGQQQCRRGLALFVETAREAAFVAGEVDEVDLLAGLGVDVPVFLDVGIADQVSARGSASPCADRR